MHKYKYELIANSVFNISLKMREGIFKPYNGNWFEKFILKLTQVNKVPKHIAFITDGNRRWARQRGQSASFGHFHGTEKMRMISSVLQYIGVKEVTIYAFSIENFQRSMEEVDYLMQTFLGVIIDSLDDIDNINSYGIRFRLLGEINLLPVDIQHLGAKLMMLTDNNEKFTINLAIAYSSQYELAFALTGIRNGIMKSQIEISDIDKHLLDKCLYTADSYPVDFVVRTSGVHRLSNFLLWQLDGKMFFFLRKEWPKISVIDITAAILKYQYLQTKITANKQERAENSDEPEMEMNTRQKKFLEEMYKQRHQQILHLANQKNVNNTDSTNL